MKTIEELRKEFEETEFFKRTALNYTKPYLRFSDNEYKSPPELFLIVIRINSAWFMFQELKNENQD